MGVHVILDIVPQRIDAAAWADAFEETRRLVEAHPARLLGYGFRIVAGVRVPVFTRAVVQGGQEPSERRWCVVGDRATLGTGERQRMYRDLRRYTARAPSAERPLPDDILQAPPSATVRVFGEGEQSEPCQLALLAAAMLIETRFAPNALVSGCFEREQAEAARRWAKGVLGSALALPVRVDAFRLVERLGGGLEGEALVRAVDQLYLAEPGAREAALLGIFGRAEAEPWFARKLREHAAPGDPGALRLLAAHLDALHDIPRLASLACVDARGPCWAPEPFAIALAGLARPRLEEAALEQALGVVFGEGAGRLCAAFRAAGARGSGGAGPAIAQESGVEKLAGIASPAELAPGERDRVHAMALSVRDAQRERGDPTGPPPSGGAARRTVASLLSRGPTLTEDAWDWIDREPDPDLCAFLAALAAFEPADADQAALRRVLLENRVLCRYAAGVRRPEEVDEEALALGGRAMAGGCG
jgi:hypothetical protein